MKQLPALTLCMIVRDEEEHLRRCLSSVDSFVSEIIVVDTGSSDNSKAVALEHGATVIDFPWSGDFSEARNAGLRKASNKWILVLDADEEWGEADMPALRALLEQPGIYGCYVQLTSYVGANSGEEYVTDAVCRLFRNDARISYEGRIHEDIAPSIKSIPGAALVYAPLAVKHYGYLDSFIRKKRKSERNLSLLLEIAARQPEDLRMQYALGTEYFQLGDYARALGFFFPLIHRIPVYEGYTSDLVLKTIFSLRETGKSEQAEELADEALLFYPDFPDLLELKASICLDRGKPAEALDAIGQALQCGGASIQYTTTSGSGSFRSHYLAGTIRERLMDWPEAIHHYRASLDANPGYGPAWRRMAVITLSLGMEQPWSAAYPNPGRIPVFAWAIWLEAALDARRTGDALELSERPEKVQYSPFLRAVLHAQLGERERARTLLYRLLAASHTFQDASLYLWALSMKEGDTEEGLLRFKQLSIGDPSFSAVEAMLQGLPYRSFPITAYRRCQLALLRVGAWETFLDLRSAPPFDRGFPWLPEGGMFGFLQSPPACRRKLLEQCGERTDRLAYSDLIAAGTVAHSLEEFGAARRFFALARAGKPERLEPLAGLANSYADECGRLEAAPLQLMIAVPMCLIVP